MLKKRNKKRSHPVEIIRKAIGKSRAHFAHMIGCSPDAIKSIEMGRLPVSKKMARRIYSATGCVPGELLKGFDGKAVDLWGVPYMKESFQNFQKHFGEGKGKEWTQTHLKAVLGWAELVLTVAEEKKSFPAVNSSLIDWLISVREDFNLGAAIDRELKDRKIPRVETYTLGDLLFVPGLAKQVGFRDSLEVDKYKERLSEERTFHMERSVRWNPYSNEPPPPCKPLRPPGKSLLSSPHT